MDQLMKTKLALDRFVSFKYGFELHCKGLDGSSWYKYDRTGPSDHTYLARVAFSGSVLDLHLKIWRNLIVHIQFDNKL
jgi:hypothetical protein